MEHRIRVLAAGMSLSCVLLCACCAPRQLMQGNEVADIWHMVQRIGIPAPAFKGEGELKLENVHGQKMSVEFSAAAISDSLLRVDFYSPFGSSMASVRLSKNRFLLETYQQDPRRGTYNDSLFREFLGVDIPLPLLLCMFTGRPFAPMGAYDSTVQEKNLVVYHVSEADSVFTKVKVNLKNKRPVLLVKSRRSSKLYSMEWSKYAGDTPLRTAVFFFNEAYVQVQFNKITVNPEIPLELFNLE